MLHEKPLLQNETITRLFLGDSYKQRGVLHFIGNIEADPMIAQGCLKLVSKLLDYQKNIFAEAYNRILARQEVSLIKSMKLELHMKTSLFAKDHVISILDSYLTGNPRVDIRLILCDSQACDAFTRGQRVRKNCNLVFIL